MHREATTDEEVRKLHNSRNPTLIMIRGIPGGGKSYLAGRLQELIGKGGVVILDPDIINQASKEYVDFSRALATEGVDLKLHPYRYSRSKAYEAIISHKVIIWTQAFIDLDGFSKTVKNLQAFASEHSTQLPTLVVEVEIDEDTAKERTTKRAAQDGRNVPEEALARFISNYESFSDKGYDVIVVNGKDDVAISTSSVMKALKEFGK